MFHHLFNILFALSLNTIINGQAIEYSLTDDLFCNKSLQGNLIDSVFNFESTIYVHRKDSKVWKMKRMNKIRKDADWVQEGDSIDMENFLSGHNLRSFNSALYTNDGFLFVFLDQKYYVFKMSTNGVLNAWNGERRHGQFNPLWDAKPTGFIKEIFPKITTKIKAATFTTFFHDQNESNEGTRIDLAFLINGDGKAYLYLPNGRSVLLTKENIPVAQLKGVFFDNHHLNLVMNDSIIAFYFYGETDDFTINLYNMGKIWTYFNCAEHAFKIPGPTYPIRTTVAATRKTNRPTRESKTTPSTRMTTTEIGQPKTSSQTKPFIKPTQRETTLDFHTSIITTPGEGASPLNTEAGKEHDENERDLRIIYILLALIGLIMFLAIILAFCVILIKQKRRRKCGMLATFSASSESLSDQEKSDVVVLFKAPSETTLESESNVKSKSIERLVRKMQPRNRGKQ